ncbi:SusD/RagB family nutrient-binding outer membrane lipoprotein [Parapedobacter sp. ISTM3]|uniref:SusD/RagB family nutrient-binding outer membrane lipoprotein n=1 Tax=Parapedobacter sp. ISTM3 TaxID=2800130 RepID=UPI001906F9AB|nr:SusD/RagB family nutrient-binding outer membrane lipoprotein [Parapedobacter sp. ISTM3]MBK1438689.1 SusD/RagB family nutrient-binding outer membrane lipoprotein [Parapedobacter sp. ISTM3]
MKTYIFSFIFAAVLCAGCENFIDVNENPNAPTAVDEKLLLAPLCYQIAHNLTAGDGTLFVNYFMQNVALNQPVPNHGTYLLVPNEFNATWTALYATCLKNLALLRQQAEERQNFNYSGIAKILTAYCLGLGTAVWGDMPYSQSLQGENNFNPAYDSQESIYQSIQQLLDEGIADINRTTGLTPGNDDFFFGGNMGYWVKAAYTLKARFYMHLTKAPGYTPSQQATQALQALEQGYGSNDENMAFSYPGGAGTQSRWFTRMLPIETIVLSANAVDTLVSRADPRLPLLVAPARSDGQYRGRPLGQQGIGNLESYSILGSYYGSQHASVHLLTYSEALFIRAEATLIVSGHEAAEPLFREAIIVNMEQMGLSRDDTDVHAYLETRLPLTAANALARIMEDKKIANFLSAENFNDWRRTGFPRMEPVENALSAIPRRFLYPLNEVSTNPQPQHSAMLTDRVWWDQP